MKGKTVKFWDRYVFKEGVNLCGRYVVREGVNFLGRYVVREGVIFSDRYVVGEGFNPGMYSKKHRDPTMLVSYLLTIKLDHNDARNTITKYLKKLQLNTLD